MIVVILAAGQGKRLYPLTKKIPKCLVKYKGISIIDYQLKIFKKFKLNKIYLVSGYKSEKIKLKGIIKIKNNEYNTTNMVYSLFTLKKIFDGKHDIIVSYGDIIYKKEILKKVISNKFNLSTVIDKNWYKYWKERMHDPLSDAESLELDRNNNIISIGKKVSNLNKIKGQYIGLTKISKKIAPKIKNIWLNLYKKNSKTKIDNLYFTDFLTTLIKKKIKLKAIIVKRGWLEFDLPNDLKIPF